MTTQTVLDNQRILLIGSENDPLNSGFARTVHDGEKSYPSVDHYAYVNVLLQLGLGAHLDKVLAASPSGLSSAMRRTIKSNLPNGTSFNEIRDFVDTCRLAFTRIGLRLRLMTDGEFARVLLTTGESMLVVCDGKDLLMGVGLDEIAFKTLRVKQRLHASQLLYWTQNPGTCPTVKIGQNALGLMLMSLRNDIRADHMRQIVESDDYQVHIGDRKELVYCTDQLQTLNGQLRPLSNCYAQPVIVKHNTYSSVEHYVYDRLLRACDMPDVYMKRIRSVVRPCDVWRVATKMLVTAGENNEINVSDKKMDNIRKQMPKWYQRAVTAKLELYPLAKRLLMSTGAALLADCHQPCGCDERQLMRVMSRPYVNGKLVVQWMADPKQCPRTLQSAFKENMTGVLLMRLRQRLVDAADDNQLQSCLSHRLVALPTLPSYGGLVSQHVVCFTAASILHPMYASPVLIAGQTYPSAMHYVVCEACDYFGMRQPTREKLLAIESPMEASALFYKHLAAIHPPIEQMHAWCHTDELETLRRALRFRFEQHAVALRALVDTEDALLLFCSPPVGWHMYEWGVGMREKDIREWMLTCKMSSGQLIDLTCQPPSQRPAGLGGNRLGMLMIELRKEFTLRGCVPSALPELTMTPEQILGSDSPLQNVDVLMNDDVDDKENATWVWYTAFTLLARRCEDEEMLATALYRPVHVSREDGKARSPPLPNADLDTADVNMLRTMVVNLMDRLKRLRLARENQAAHLKYVTDELDRVAELRKIVEEKRDAELKLFEQPIDESPPLVEKKNDEVQNMEEGETADSPPPVEGTTTPMETADTNADPADESAIDSAFGIATDEQLALFAAPNDDETAVTEDVEPSDQPIADDLVEPSVDNATDDQPTNEESGEVEPLSVTIDANLWGAPLPSPVNSTPTPPIVTTGDGDIDDWSIFVQPANQPSEPASTDGPTPTDTVTDDAQQPEHEPNMDIWNVQPPLFGKAPETEDDVVHGEDESMIDSTNVESASVVESVTVSTIESVTITDPAIPSSATTDSTIETVTTSSTSETVAIADSVETATTTESIVHSVTQSIANSVTSETPATERVETVAANTETKTPKSPDAEPHHDDDGEIDT